MKLIIKKFKGILFVSICIFIHNSILAIDPVEIGKPYQKDVEINLSIIENLNQDIKKGQLQMNLYDMEDRKKTKRKLLNIEKVLSLEYASNGKKIVFSGVNTGQTDLYLYNVVGNSQKQLTNCLLYTSPSPRD